ncbi:MAG: hypothetical protein JWQ23_172 [Herminiimonas sp.]|nr:hypothetical protein [Herminiimonas sp.]
MRLQPGLQQILLGLALILSILPAYAFERLFPPIAKRGTLSTEDYPTITINGKVRQLSAGAWIRNENNTIDMPASLRGRRFVVNFTENNQGEIDRVWILSPTEANAVPPNERQINQGLIQAQ